MALDLSGDWQIVDDLQTVTFYSKTSRTAYAAGETVTHVLKRVVTKDYDESGGLLKRNAVVFHVWRAKVTATPKQGDAVQAADAKRYTVDRVEVMDEGERFRLSCVEE